MIYDKGQEADVAPQPPARARSGSDPRPVDNAAPDLVTAAAEPRARGSAGIFAAQLLAIFVALNLIALFALPQDKFIRYQTPNDPQAPNMYWIYERIHFDPTPIDVAFIGSSRTGQSVHSRRLEEDLARRGIDIKAVNFFSVRSGVNIQYVIAKELLDNRKIKLLVLEIEEREERVPHDAFALYADTSDVLSAPILINVNYLSDIAHLPGRQVRLAYETALERLGMRHPDFVVPPYEGPNLDFAEYITSIDHVTHEQLRVHTRAEMDAMRMKWLRQLTPPILPPWLSDLEYRFPRYYENKLLDLGRAHGAKVVFLYTPSYGGPPNPEPYGQYVNRAGLIDPWPVLRDAGLWTDTNHLNWAGARRATDYIADALADRPDLLSGTSAAPPARVAGVP